MQGGHLVVVYSYTDIDKSNLQTITFNNAQKLSSVKPWSYSTFCIEQYILMDCTSELC